MGKSGERKSESFLVPVKANDRVQTQPNLVALKAY